MENANNKKGSFMGLLPLVIFLVVYFAMGIGTGDFGERSGGEDFSKCTYVFYT